MSGSTTVLDSTSNGTSTTLAGNLAISSSVWRGAVFTAGDSSPTYAITGVRFGLTSSTAAAYSLTLSLYATSGTTPTGSALASASFSISLTSTLSYAYVAGVSLGTLASASLTSGGTYALVLSATTTGARMAISTTGNGNAYTRAGNFAGNGLTITNNSGASWGSAAFTPLFQLQVQATCFMRGTLILTARGEVPVEHLREGDLVATRFSGLRPIRWVGTQTFEGCLAGPAHQPIRLARGSLGPGIPACDLWVSPGHAMLVEGVLVHAGALVNGITITQPGLRGVIEYYHLDLGEHDCVLACGAWAESYFEDRNRDSFHNAAEFHARFPGHAPVRQGTCLPVIAAGTPAAAALRDAVAPPAAACAA